MGGSESLVGKCELGQSHVRDFMGMEVMGSSK
jgi:hypothetical protein